MTAYVHFELKDGLTDAEKKAALDKIQSLKDVFGAAATIDKKDVYFMNYSDDAAVTALIRMPEVKFVCRP